MSSMPRATLNKSHAHRAPLLWAVCRVANPRDSYGYRDYPARMRREVVFIAMSRQLGFSLSQIALRLDEYRAGTLGQR